MKVAPELPFQIIYSLYQHEYLGYLFESFVVQKNEKGNLTLSHQNISSKNAFEFQSGLNDADYELIKYMDEIQQESVIGHFVKKRVKPNEFFLKTFNKQSGDATLQKEILSYVERRRKQIMPLLSGKSVFETGVDGEPTWKELEVLDEKATILFHFRKNEDNTHYFPTIKLLGEKKDFRNNGSYIVAEDPAYMVSENRLFSFDKPINGAKLRPFLSKKFILIPGNIEETYYEKFVAPLVESYDVYAKGFDIRTEKLSPHPVLSLSEIKEIDQHKAATLFDNNGNDPEEVTKKVLFELSFEYGKYNYRADTLKAVSVSLEKQNGDYTFYRINRDSKKERSCIDELSERGLTLRNSRLTLDQGLAFSWLTENQSQLKELGFRIQQNRNDQSKYFLGEYSIDLKITEDLDWFDIRAIVKFGDFEVPFQTIRKLILSNKSEIKLPNGEVAVIPDIWKTNYRDLFAFADEHEKEIRLKKHHIALVKELKESNAAKVAMDRKLERLLNFQEIEEADLPVKFKGKLRPYQKSGFDWMRFLNEYNFGGCLADDMGLGKTVQALVLLQSEAELNTGTTSLLIMPTSLIYNWEEEARRFTPKLKLLNYTGTARLKDPASFANYDLVITSYGITRLDADLLAEFYFNYVILDESQAIKNPDSIISQCVRKLNSRRSLILTGTPIENSTMDLWSQISFLNPGLLGTKAYFKKEYLIPIEKKKDEAKSKRLNTLIKPFVLRRDKSQVAKDLPEKVVNIRYCHLSEHQRERYDKEKNAFRNKILELIENNELKNSPFTILQGLTRLRQIANHPKLVDEDYEFDSGKLEDITYMIQNALGKDHKLLVFSQFVKHLKIIAEYLDDQQIGYAYLDGSVKDRKSQVEKFQNQPDIGVFLISLKAGGLGLNLTKADYVFILDPWWNPAAEAQAMDRAHRIGQKNKVFIYKFIVRDTVEEKILKLQQSKLRLAQDLITVEESFVKSLSTDDIKSLFT